MKINYAHDVCLQISSFLSYDKKRKEKRTRISQFQETYSGRDPPPKNSLRGKDSSDTYPPIYNRAKKKNGFKRSVFVRVDDVFKDQ